MHGSPEPAPAGSGPQPGLAFVRDRAVDCPRCGYALRGLGTVGDPVPAAVRCSECGTLVDPGRAHDIVEEHRRQPRPPIDAWRAACRPAFTGTLGGLAAGKIHFTTAWVRLGPDDALRGDGFWTIEWSLGLGLLAGIAGFALAAAWTRHRLPGLVAASAAVGLAIAAMLAGTLCAVIGVFALAAGGIVSAAAAGLLLVACVAVAALFDGFARRRILRARLRAEAVIEGRPDAAAS